MGEKFLLYMQTFYINILADVITVFLGLNYWALVSSEFNIINN